MDYIGIKDIEFDAICSGDGERFCWLVDKNIYTQIKGWDDELSPFDSVNKNKFRIYPSDIFGYDSKRKHIKISWNNK